MRGLIRCGRLPPCKCHILDSPGSRKAFTETLRLRLRELRQGEATTKRRLADGMGEPQSKVPYHRRTLLDAESIGLTEQRVRGGSVEQYSRAVARRFGLRPASGRPRGADRRRGRERAGGGGQTCCMVP